MSYRIVGGFEALREHPDAYVVNCIFRDMATRKMTSELLKSYGAKFTNIIHPSVSCSHVNMGIGNIIGRNVTLEAGSRIGDHNVILHNSVIAHDTRIGSYCFIGHHCTIQGFNTIGDCVYLGAGTTTVPGIKIGSGSRSGINSSLCLDLQMDSVVISSPSRNLKCQTSPN